MRDYQRYASVVAVFATVLYLALVVAAFGMISLLTDLDVISEPDAGPLVGPSATGASVLLVFVMMLQNGLKTRPEWQRVNLGFALGTGVAAFGVFIIVGALLYAVGAGALFEPISFAVATLLRPFSWAIGALALIVALVYSWLLASRMAERPRLLWPWERPDE